jgi:hypothetical protein
MPTKKEFDETLARHEEAVVLYEMAKAEFESLAGAIAAQLAAGAIPSNADLLKEEQARAKLATARRRKSAYEKS